jgi:hypothetical protein
VLHQPVMLVAAYWLFPLGFPLATEPAALIAITGGGSLAIHHLLIRPPASLLLMFGLRLRPAVAATKAATV